jgi:NAD(P)-dependent dehydrogenase (short-subunit alcohol dehydrogenase family)
MIDLKGHSALITGSTRGVGRSIAEAFAAAGANVVLHGRSRDANAEEVVANCQSSGVNAEFVTADLMAETIPVVDRLFADALAVLPGIDILVNNAGTYIDQPYLEMDWATYDRTMRLNVAAPYFITQRFARHRISVARDSVAGSRHGVAGYDIGRVLMIGSINGRLAEPTHSCYDTSRAIDAMVRSLAVVRAHNIRVNGLAPGCPRRSLRSSTATSGSAAGWSCTHRAARCRRATSAAAARSIYAATTPGTSTARCSLSTAA